MPYCPIHRYEYMPGIKVCPECGAELVDELAEPVAPADVKWTRLRPLPGMIYAKMVTEVLDQRGIPNYIQSLFGSGGLGVISGDDFPGADTRIWVPEPFVEEATEIMDEIIPEE
jgi:hypothetical protein